jgi:hypothetical protein
MTRTRVIRLEDLGVVVTEDIRKYFDEIEVEAGIINEALYKNGKSLQEVASILQKKYGWIDKGLESGKNNDLKTAIDIVVKGLSDGRFSEQQFINAVAACFINPINRKEFGSNKPSVIKAKGFDHVMVHTGLFISKIKARLTRGVQNV